MKIVKVALTVMKVCCCGSGQPQFMCFLRKLGWQLIAVLMCVQRWQLTMPLQIRTVTWLRICGRKPCLSSHRTRSSPTSWQSVQREVSLLSVQRNRVHTSWIQPHWSCNISELSSSSLWRFCQLEINGRLYQANSNSFLLVCLSTQLLCTLPDPFRVHTPCSKKQ